MKREEKVQDWGSKHTQASGDRGQSEIQEPPPQNPSLSVWGESPGKRVSMQMPGPAPDLPQASRGGAWHLCPHPGTLAPAQIWCGGA